MHQKIFAADEYVRDLQASFQKIKDAIQESQQKQKRAADKHRRFLAFKEDDWVLLKFSKARLRHTTGKDWQGMHSGHQKYYAKLARRYYGPFQIQERINETTYRLRLPSSWHIHNAFHVSLLKPFKGTPPTEPLEEEPPKFDELEELLQPEAILRHEDKILRNGKVLRKYLIKFKNYAFDDAKWMREPQLKDSMALVPP